MWTPAARAQLAREASPYATGLTDAEWALVAPLLPAPSGIGRPRRWPMRTILEAILYVLRTGCAWRHLPHDFPPWGTVLRWDLAIVPHRHLRASRLRAHAAGSRTGGT